MALDGLVISNIVYELSETLTGGRINKIYQPEPDALILGIKNNRTNYKLLISASASLPLIYLTDDTGVRVEDLVLVTEDGCEVLNHYSKELQIIG